MRQGAPTNLSEPGFLQPWRWRFKEWFSFVFCWLLLYGAAYPFAMELSHHRNFPVPVRTAIRIYYVPFSSLLDFVAGPGVE